MNGSQESQLCLASTKAKREENRPHKRSVKFEDGKLVSAVFDPPRPWDHVESLNPYELIGAYKLRCDIERLEPLYSVLSQLENIDLKYSHDRRPQFRLKGTQLNEAHVEVLEEVFKRVQFEYLNLENTNLSDDALIAICDMIEFYGSCTELSLARNCRIQSAGWSAVAKLIRKLPCLKWLDLRSAALTEPDAQRFTQSIRSQALFCRAELNRFNNAYASGKPPSQQRMGSHSKAINDTLFHSPCTGLHGLHLGGTYLRDTSLSNLLNSVRLSFISDLRLSDNKLGSSDATSLVPLIRYGSSLKYLDLSRNLLGDDGCKVVSDAMASTSFADQPSDSPKTGLRFLSLSENLLTSASMLALGHAVTKTHSLASLQLSGNCELSSYGLLALQSGLFRSRQLRRLDLANCGIDCTGAIALAETLIDQPRRLKVINVGHNPIGTAGLLALARCLPEVRSRIEMFGFSCPQTQNSHQISELAKDQNLNATSDLADATPSTDRLYCETLELFNNRLQENHAKFPETRSKSKPRYCQLSCSAHNVFGCASYSEDIDARYLWGDSSDEEIDTVDPGDDTGSIFDVHQIKNESVDSPERDPTVSSSTPATEAEDESLKLLILDRPGGCLGENSTLQDITECKEPPSVSH